MKTSLKEYRTDKFRCKRCQNKDMIPNKEGDFIKGFSCQICGEINYPTAQNEQDIILSIRVLQKLNKNELLRYLENLITNKIINLGGQPI